MCNRVDEDGGDEDGGHLFLKCTKVKHVWRSLFFEDVRLSLVQAPNPIVMFDLLWTMPKDKQLLSIVLLSDWWSVTSN